MKSYRNAPLASRGMPDGIPYIISNETAERFSFYGMRAILTIYMTTYLINPEGSLDVMSENEAKTYFEELRKNTSNSRNPMEEYHNYHELTAMTSLQ